MDTQRIKHALDRAAEALLEIPPDTAADDEITAALEHISKAYSKLTPPVRFARTSRDRVIKVTDSRWEDDWKEATEQEYLEMEAYIKEQVARGTF